MRATFDYSQIKEADLGGFASYHIDIPAFFYFGSPSYWPANDSGRKTVTVHYIVPQGVEPIPDSSHTVGNWNDTPENLVPQNGYLHMVGPARFYAAIPSYPKATSYFFDYTYDYTVTPPGDPAPALSQQQAAYGAAVVAWERAIDNSLITRMDVLNNSGVGFYPVVFDKAIRVVDIITGNHTITEAEVTGSPFDDEITGLAEGPNIFHASEGFDRITGGSKNDTFDYRGTDILGEQSINGGDETNRESDRNGGVDLLKLPGRPNDYAHTFVSINTFPEFVWENTFTTFYRGPLSGPPTFILSTQDMEKVEFTLKIGNVVRTKADDGIGEIPLRSSHIASEMMQLASEVYGPLPSLGHRMEPLAYETGYYPDVAFAASLRGWHRVAAIELGLKPADYGERGDLKYSFADGFYAAYDSDIFLNLDRPEANALVLSGIVNGKRTIAISFRGTDQIADFDEFLDFSNYYRKYKPLIAALKAYVNDPDNGIQQILVSGHSLGAGAAQYFMAQVHDTAQYRVKCYTDGSPGSDYYSQQTRDNRIVNFIHTDDLVTAVPSITGVVASPVAKTAMVTFATAAGIAAVAGVFSGIGSVTAGAVSAAMLRAVVNGKEKFRAGGDILINSEVASSYGIDEHDKDIYTRDVIRLQQLARDARSPFFGSEVAEALRTGEPYRGRDMQIAPGGIGNDVIHPLTADEYDLGGAGHDKFVILRPIRGMSVQTDVFASPNGRVIDGGPDFDMLIFRGFRASEITVLKAGGAAVLKFLGENVGTLTRTEVLFFPHDRDGRYFVPLNGYVLSPQLPAAGQTSLQVDHTADYTDASRGGIAVTGSGGADVIFVGPGGSVLGGDGDDVIVQPLAGPTQNQRLPGPQAAAAGPVRIEGEGGNDIVVAGDGNDRLGGGPGNDDLSGGLGDDILRGGEGLDTLIGGGGADTADYGGETRPVVVTLKGSIRAQVKVGGAAEDVLAGVENVAGGAGKDSLAGDDLANRLTGGAADDTLAGGAGNDTMEGGRGADRLLGGLAVDWASYERAGLSVTADLFNPSDNRGEAAGDTYVGIEALIGGRSGDVLRGNAAANMLDGRSGADTLHGRSGADTLTGGGGKDSFVFGALTDSGRAQGACDVIADFAAGSLRTVLDRLDLTAIDANQAAVGDQAFEFIGGRPFAANTPGTLRTDQLPSETLLWLNTDNDIAPEMLIQLAGRIAFGAGDILL